MLAGAALGALIGALVAVSLAEASGQAPFSERASPRSTSELALRIAYDDGAGTRRTATLSCQGASARAGGYLAARGARRLCRTAGRLRSLLARPPSPDRPCTQVYGGPQTARVRGHIAGRRIDRRLSRRNGCEIADWDRAAGLLPVARASS